MKKILIMALALCCSNAFAAPTKTIVSAEKAAKVTQSKTAKQSKTAAKADKTKAAEKGKTVAKADKAKPADKAKTVAKADKAKAADKGKAVAKADKSKSADKAKTLAKADKSKSADKAKTVAKASKPKAADKAKTLAKASQPKSADKSKTVAKADKGKAADKAKTVAKASKPKSADKAKTIAKANQVVSKALTKASQPQATPLPKGAQKSRESLLTQGKKLIGTPYLWGGTSPKGFDCSGLVHYLYHKQGISLPRSSRDQFAALPAVDQPQPGDLVFFRKKGVINHVGIYVGDGKMLHAPQTGSHVRIESMQKPNWQRRYAGARRALKGGNAVVASAKAPVAASKRVAKNDKDKLTGLIPNKNKVR